MAVAPATSSRLAITRGKETEGATAGGVGAELVDGAVLVAVFVGGTVGAGTWGKRVVGAGGAFCELVAGLGLSSGTWIGDEFSRAYWVSGEKGGQVRLCGGLLVSGSFPEDDSRGRLLDGRFGVSDVWT